MTVVTLDRRLNAYRLDLADARLEGQVEVGHFVEGDMMTVNAPYADMRSSPSPGAGLATQVLRGDRLRVFDRDEGWGWAQAERDGYVGYVPLRALDAARPGNGTPHRVTAPRTFVFTEPNLKRPAAAVLSLGSLVHVVGTVDHNGATYARLASGEFAFADHLARLSDVAGDYVEIAESLLGTPYLWGGATAFGLDCSGLVQLSMLMTGRTVLRDSDMQAAGLGDEVPADAPLQRGDLVFWTGHVGIMRDAETLLHANAASMSVASEPLQAAIERIKPLYGAPTVNRRT